MNVIQVKKRVKLKDPVFIAAWPGMGDVALKAALYLKEQLKAEEFATLAPEDFFFPSGVNVDNGLIDVPAHPTGHFSAARHPDKKSDVIIFTSDAQPFIEKSSAYAAQIIDFVKKLGAKTVITFAAMPLPIEHGVPPEVHAVGTSPAVMKRFKDLGLKVMLTGQISGMNGLLLGVAKQKGLDAVCLLGEIPLYTIQIENPLASIAVLGILTRAFGLSVDMTPLRARADEIQREIEHLIDFLKNPPEEEARPIDQGEIDVMKKTLDDASQLPESARLRIDELLRAAKKDLARALELKKELDKWNVYDKYEDAFLDLFKKPAKKNN